MEEQVSEEPGRVSEQRLSQEEIQALLERERARMADPNNRKTLVELPDHLLRGRRGNS